MMASGPSTMTVSATPTPSASQLAGQCNEKNPNIKAYLVVAGGIAIIEAVILAFFAVLFFLRLLIFRLRL